MSEQPSEHEGIEGEGAEVIAFTDKRASKYPPEPATRKAARKCVEEFKFDNGFEMRADFEDELVRAIELMLDGLGVVEGGEAVAWRRP